MRKLTPGRFSAGVVVLLFLLLPWQLSADPATNVNLWGLVISGLTALYVIKGGMYSVVFTEVLQAALGAGRCLVALDRGPEAVGWLDQARSTFGALGARPLAAEADRFLGHARGEGS